MTLTELKRIIQEKHLHRGDYVLSSGLNSDRYFDIKAMMGGPDKPLLINELLNYCVDKFARAVSTDDKELVFSFGSYGGLELGGALLVSTMSHPFNINCCFIRKQTREYGMRKMIEGKPVSPIMLVDDVVNSTDTVRYGIIECQKAGYEVCGILCVINRSRLELKTVWDIPLYSLFLESDFKC